MKDFYPLYSNEQASRRSGSPSGTREGFSQSMGQWSETSSSVTPGELGMKFQRRKRTSFTQEQILAMESVFSSNRYPNIYLRETLAELIGQPESRIHVWFQNRRAKHRRQNMEATHSAKAPPRVPLPSNGPEQAQSSCVPEGRSRQLQEVLAQGSSALGEGLGPSDAGYRWRVREGRGQDPTVSDGPFRASSQVKAEGEDPSPQVAEPAGDMKTHVGRNPMMVFEGDRHHFHTCAMGSEMVTEVRPNAFSAFSLNPSPDPTRQRSPWECAGRYSPISEPSDPGSDWENRVASLEARSRTPLSTRGQFF